MSGSKKFITPVFEYRGPSTTPRLLKPDLLAPGSQIVSYGTGSANYVTYTGTFYAANHLAGAICLLICNNPDITYQEIYDALASTSFQPPLSDADRNCGLITPGLLIAWNSI